MSILAIHFLFDFIVGLDLIIFDSRCRGDWTTIPYTRSVSYTRNHSSDSGPMIPIPETAPAPSDAG